MSSPMLPLLLATAAWATPAPIGTQGRLLDGDGVPVDDTLDVTFRVIDAETGGSTLWEESHAVTFTNGFYSVVLGADEAGNPLTDDILDQWPLWLEVQVDGQPAMVPRTALGSVPYARLAGTASAVVGEVDATSITVGGSEIVDGTGAWVGPAPDVNWSDLTGVPGDFSDGDDADTLADLVCADGQWAMWDASASAWSCDGFSDTTLSSADVVAAVEGAAIDLAAGSSMDGYSLLAEESAIEWDWLVGVPADLEDGDDDTLGGLSCADEQVAAWDASAAAWVCADDATLTESEVEAFITDDALDLPAGTTVDGVSLGDSSSPPCTITGTSGTTATLTCGGTSVTFAQAPVYERVLAADTDFRCVLDTGGSIHCTHGYWGQGVISDVRDATVRFTGGGSTIDVCALDRTGALTCYGRSGTSQPVTGSGYTALAGDEDHGCVIDASGAPSCWGSASLSGTFDTVTGDQYRVCGITTSGALLCDFPGRSYHISDAGPWDWVDTRSGTVCAGESTGATYCWWQTSSGVTPHGVAGTWSSFSGQIYATSTPQVYGCGVLSTGTLRCVLPTGATIDHAGTWSDAVLAHYGTSASYPGFPAAITTDGELFDPVKR